MADSHMFYAQFGEDRGLHALFGEKSDGLCVEVGANDGINGSNTLFFEKLGWDCILVEPNPELCEAMRAFRTARIFDVAASDRDGTAVLQIAIGANGAHALSTMDPDAGMRTLRAHGFESRPVEVPTRRLDTILEQAVGGKPIDFITIDVEGHEISALSGLSLDRWRPRVVLVESNNASSGQTVSQHLGKYGYVRFRRTGVNDWYAHRTDAELGTNVRQMLYTPSRWLAQARMASTTAKVTIGKIPGVLSVWYFGKRMLGRSGNGA